MEWNSFYGRDMNLTPSPWPSPGGRGNSLFDTANSCDWMQPTVQLPHLPTGEGMVCLTQQIHVTGSKPTIQLAPLLTREGMVCLTQQVRVTGSNPLFSYRISRRERDWSNNPCMFFNLTPMYFGFTPSPSVRERVGERVYLSADRESHEEHSGYQTKSHDSRIG